MLNIRQASNGTFGTAHRAMCYFLCLILVAAGLVEFQRHTLHAAHQHDTFTSATSSAGVMHGSGLLAVDAHIHEHGTAAAILHQHNTGPSHDHDQSGTGDCGPICV